MRIKLIQKAYSERIGALVNAFIAVSSSDRLQSCQWFLRFCAPGYFLVCIEKKSF
jgi:hypothetical protein